MTGYANDPTSGSMLPGQGKTNIVKLSPLNLDPKDKAVLCKAICVCSTQPDTGKDGQNLKQQCVSRNLRTLDSSMGYLSPYKPEINYRMDTDPPQPITDSAIATKAHDWLPGWIQKYWPGGSAGYTPNTGMIRRPDVVIVNDPSLPPTQDNIKNVVEIKFPPDTASREQMDAYEQIAGDPGKVVTMGPKDCDCSDEPQEQGLSSKVSELGNSFADTLKGLLRRRQPFAVPTLPGLPGLPTTPPLVP